MKKTMIALLLTSILAGSACFALTGCKNAGDAEATAAPTVAATTAATEAATQAATQEKGNDTSSKVDTADNNNTSSAVAEATEWELNDYDDEDIDYHYPMNYTDEHAVEKVLAELGYGEGYSASSGGWITLPGDSDIWHNVLIYEGYTSTDDDIVASYYLNDRTDEILTTVELEARAYGDTLN